MLVLWTSLNFLLIILVLPKYGPSGAGLPEAGAPRKGEIQAVLLLGSPSPSCMV